MAQFYVDENGQFQFGERPAAQGVSFSDFKARNPDLIQDPSIGYDAHLNAAREKGSYIPPNNGMIEVSTGPNQLWHLDPATRTVWRTNELQPGVRWGADPSNDFLSGKDGWRDAATIAAMFGAAYGGGALLGGEAAAGAVGD